MAEKEIYEHAILVTAGHLDELNHVNNVTYLQWVQDVAKAHWNLRAPEELKKEYIWVVINHFLEYKKPAFLGEELAVKNFR